MSRNIWILLTAAFLLLVLLGAGAVGGLFWYRQHRSEQAYARAEEFYAKGEWNLAKANYAHYISKNPEDVETLEKYADAALRIPSERDTNLVHASSAYMQIIQHTGDPAYMAKLLELQERRGAWQDLEYYADLFERNHGSSDTLRYYRALALELQERDDEAIEAYQRTLEQGTEYLDAYGNLAALYEEMGRSEEADQVIASLNAAHADTPARFIQIARLQQLRDELDAAMASIDAGLAEAPNDADLLLAQARLFAQRKEWDRAVAAAERAVQADPDDALTSVTLALAHQQAGEIDEAIATLEALKPEVRADYAQVYVQLAEWQFMQNRIEDAEKTIGEYKSAYPEHLTMFRYLDGLKLLYSGNASDAATQLAIVVSSNPGLSRAQYYLVLAYQRAGKLDEAELALGTYLRNNPNDPAGQALYRQLHENREQLTANIESAETLLNEGEAEPAALVDLARRLYDGSRGTGTRPRAARQAIALLERAAQLDPETRGLYGILSGLYIETEQFDQAEAAIEQARATGDSGINVAMAESALALHDGDRGKALELALTTLENPDVTFDDKLRWGSAFAQWGHVEAAIDLLEAVAAQHTGRDQTRVLLERVALLRRVGELDRAYEVLSGMAWPEGVESTALDEERSNMAEALLVNAAGDATRLNRAGELIEAIKASSPRLAALPMLEARMRLQQTPPDLEGAKNIVDLHLSSSPRDTGALLLAAEIRAREAAAAVEDSGTPRLDASIDFARRAVSSAPDEAGPKIYLARLHMTQGDHREGQSILEDVLRQDPSDRQALEVLLDSYRASGALARADDLVADLTAEAAASPELASAVNALKSTIALQTGENLAEAEADLRALYEANPDNFGHARDLAAALAAQDRLTEAREVMASYAEAHPEQPAPWLVLAEYQLTGNDPDTLDAAWNACTKALLAQPNYAPALRLMIEVQRRGNRVGEALRLCDRYLAINPQDTDVLYQKALMSAQRGGGFDEAKAAIDEALALRPGQDEYHLLRARIQLGLQQYAAALEDLEAARDSRFANTAEYHIDLAEAYLGMAELDQAQRHYDRAAADYDSSSPVLQQRLDSLEARLRQAKEGAA